MEVPNMIFEVYRQKDHNPIAFVLCGLGILLYVDFCGYVDFCLISNQFRCLFNLKFLKKFNRDQFLCILPDHIRPTLAPHYNITMDL